MILLLWVFLFPSILSFPVLLLVVVDLLLTRPSNRLITRAFIMDYLKTQRVEGSAHAGKIDMVLESLYERCVLLPNAPWRLLTLLYIFCLQVHSFFGSVGFTYGASSPKWLFALFGNRLGARFAGDKYIQFVLLCAAYGYSLVVVWHTNHT